MCVGRRERESSLLLSPSSLSPLSSSPGYDGSGSSLARGRTKRRREVKRERREEERRPGNQLCLEAGTQEEIELSLSLAQKAAEEGEERFSPRKEKAALKSVIDYKATCI